MIETSLSCSFIRRKTTVKMGKRKVKKYTDILTETKQSDRGNESEALEPLLMFLLSFDCLPSHLLE